MSMSLSIADLQRVAFGRQSSLRRFWHWWTAELRGALPSRLRQYLHASDRTLRVSLQQRHVSIALRSSDDNRRIADFDLQDASGDAIDAVRRQLHESAAAARSCVIELPDEHVLRRTVNLPVGTEERLEDVLEFEMDRFTPFKCGQVYFAYEVTGRDAGNGQITVQLVVALRSLVDEVLVALDKCGLEVSAIHAGNNRSPSNSRALDLLPKERRPRSGLRNRMLSMSLTAAASVLLVAVLVLPLFFQQSTLKMLQQDIATVQPAALAVAETRDDIAELMRQRGFFASERRASPTVVSVMDEVTRVIPDNTWLARYEMRGSTIRLQGESESASSLIALLEASDLIQGARFSSPVTKNPRTSNDRFVIEAQIQPSGSLEE